ncbi:MAG: DUF1343 domain-containing protein [Bdellovibrionales bacterium]|nr:DUF1343 domain-containing protein [Bdellovibrionales bacterium]
MKFKLGIDRLISDSNLRKGLNGKRVALIGHPASMTSPEFGFIHSLDALAKTSGIRLSSAFGPQHGMRGDKQDNMIESDDFRDPVLQIPIFSLYGKVRRPTPEMIDSFDVLLFDIQDVGCRIYTFLTTLLYCMEACAKAGKSIWVLDRPNPAGRPIEGMALQPGWQSFVGAAAKIPMRHGLTLGEAAKWFKKEKKLDVDLNVIEMEGYRPDEGPGFGWPLHTLPWVNPSPNAASLSMARAYAGTVMIEGTTLSEGRGTTRPLEMQGAPDLRHDEILKWMRAKAPEWMKGCLIRPCFFDPTFHKHQKTLNSGFQIHVDHSGYDHGAFKPYRLISLWFKAIREIQGTQYPIWRDFAYEYETTRLAIDLINGNEKLRQWVDDSSAKIQDFEKLCAPDEKAWADEVRPLLIYS